MAHLVITGGAGFIGSNFVHWLLAREPETELVVVDDLTYAGNPANLEAVREEIRFVKADIADPGAMRPLLEGADGLINFAAESHVDRSLESAAPFLHSNAVGVQALLDLVRDLEVPRFLQVSTDEVYGPAPEGVRFDEEAHLNPSSPYAASKAAGDLLVNAAVTTWEVPVLITRACNNYGPFQFPEKLIPLMITNIMEGRELPVYGDGMQQREWMHVREHCAALWAVWEGGRPGRVYNIGTGEEVPNLDLVRTLVRVMEADPGLITFVADRPGHDRRYALDVGRLRQEIGWSPSIALEEGLEETVRWYQENRDWWEAVKSGAYRDYYQRMYGERGGAD
ncbi:MAG: dTDP-glucose 4,6-dehydratase [bacterium]